MEFSGVLYILILIGLFILNKKISKLASHFDETHQRLSRKLDRITETNNQEDKHTGTQKTQEPASRKAQTSPTPKKPIVTPPPKKATPATPTPVQKTAKPTPAPTPQEAPIKAPVTTEYRPTELRVLDEKPSLQKPKEKAKSFMERNPDLEKFIGENLLSKIGIVIFVIGMGFLVKLGIDNNYITEGMRIMLGVIIGGGLIGLAHRLRKSFMAFSSVLIGGGLAVLYFTIAIAFHEYQILSQTPAFIIMVAITAFGVLLSISYDKKELAILALIGGFGTPFFLSTGEGNVTRFIYLHFDFKYRDANAGLL